MIKDIEKDENSPKSGVDESGRFGWYAVKVVSGQEKKIKSYLENEIHRLNYQEVVRQVEVPSERVYELRGGKKRIKERSFLPGYVMVHADLTDPEIVHALRQVPGVMSFLGSMDKREHKPVALRKQEVNRLLGKIDDETEEEIPHMEHLYVMGEEIKVIDGPFGGFTGSVDEINEEKHKLRVVVKIFGRSTPIELGFHQVEKIG